MYLRKKNMDKDWVMNVCFQQLSMEVGLLWCGGVLCRHRVEDLIQVNHSKRTILFDFAKSCFTVWCTHDWKKITLSMRQWSKTLINIISKLPWIKQKQHIFGYYDLASSIFEPLPIELELDGWVKIEYPKSESELFKYLKNAREGLLSFQKQLAKKAKDL